jgi:hypothetical protein
MQIEITNSEPRNPKFGDVVRVEGCEGYFLQVNFGGSVRYVDVVTGQFYNLPMGTATTVNAILTIQE